MRGQGRGVRAAAARVLFVALCAGAASCSWSGGTRESNPRVYGLNDRVPEGGGRYKLGDPYQVEGQWFYPREDPNYDRTGIASWYGEYFHGRKTANGEWYDMNRLSAAHPTMPLPSYARVTNLENHRSIVVRVNDRGPFKRDRIIDLSHEAAKEIGILRAGTGPVRVTYISPAPLSGDVRNMQTVDRRRGLLSPFLTASAGETPSGGDTGEPTAHEAAGGPAGAPEITGATAASRPPRQILPSGFYVQAAAFTSETRARSLAEQLADLGSFAVLPAEIAGDTYYRVRLGPVASYAEAEGVVAGLAAAGLDGGRIFAN